MNISKTKIMTKAIDAEGIQIHNNRGGERGYIFGSETIYD